MKPAAITALSGIIEQQRIMDEASAARHDAICAALDAGATITSVCDATDGALSRHVIRSIKNR